MHVMMFILNVLNRRNQQLKDELEEFQEGSRDLEAELEAQLEQAETRAKDLAVAKTKLEQENEVLKVNYKCM